MRAFRIRDAFSIILLLAGLGLLLWGAWPKGREFRTFNLPVTPLPLDEPGGNLGTNILEKDLVEVHWEQPKRMIWGRLQTLVAAINLNELGEPSLTNNIAGAQKPGNAELAHILDRYNLVAETRIDSVGYGLEPSGSMRQPIRPGQPIEFRWSLDPRKSGEYSGELWVYLNLVEKGGNGNDQVALLAFPFEIRVLSLFGLRYAYILGVGAFFVFLFILLNIEYIEKIVIMRLKR